MAQTITLNFNIIGQSLERLDDNRIVEKAKNYVNTHFEFNELWDDTTKTILIEGSGLRYKVYLNENNECSIPNRVVRHDGFTLTVVGEDTDKNITITTNDLFISILSNNATDDTPNYVEEIESETLDVTREGEKYNIEIPSEYVTNEKLSQELENYVDNESLEETLEDYAKETDLSVYATKQELAEKSKVVPNPTLSGDEPNLEGAEIDGIKYKVGGGVTLDDIVDAGGNKRFVEGTCNLSNKNGITWTYNKWSLSGTHLMIVICGRVTSSSVSITTNSFGNVVLPSYIKDKIRANSNNRVEIKTMNFYDPYLAVADTVKVLLSKWADLALYWGEEKTLSANGCDFRIQFDLLIDAS